MFDHSLHLTRPWTARLRAVVSGAVISACVMGVQGTAFAQSTDMQILLDRMERMERDIRTLNQQIARGATAMPEATAQGTGASVPTPAPQIEYNEGEGAMARFNVRLGALEQEVRQATGMAEGMNYRIDQLNARLDKLIGDLDFRLGRLEGGSSMGSLAQDPGLSSAPTPSAMPSPPSVSKVGEMAPPTAMAEETGTVDKTGLYRPGEAGGGSLGTVSQKTLQQITSSTGETPPAAAPDDEPKVAAVAPKPAPGPAPQATPTPAQPSASVLPAGTPREQYQFAFGLMSQARYDDAEAAFKEFIQAHGEDALAGNARYWLGESYYVRKSYMDAAQTFFQAYQFAPQGAKAPDSLLKLGMSMGNLDKTEEACATYTKLRKEFATLKPTIEKNLNREVKRLNCR